MKSKRAEEFINGHIKIGNLQFTVADIEYCVMLAEQDAEERIEALKARAVEAYRTHCRRYTNPCIWTTRNKCPDTCAYLQDFIQKINEQ